MKTFLYTVCNYSVDLLATTVVISTDLDAFKNGLDKFLEEGLSLVKSHDNPNMCVCV